MTEVSRLRLRACVGRFALQFVWPHRTTILYAFLGMLAQALLTLPIPLAQGRALDEIVHPQGSSGSAMAMPVVVAALAVAGVCVALRSALSWAANSAMTRVSLQVAATVTDEMHRKLQRLSLSFFDRQATGNLMARITSDVGSALIFLNSGSIQLASDMLLAIGITIVLFWLDWPLALIACAAMPILALNHRILTPKVRRQIAAARDQLGRIYGLASERISSVRLVRAFAQEPNDLADFTSQTDRHLASGWNGVRLAEFRSAIAAACTGLAGVAVVVSGLDRVRSGELSIGQLLAFYSFTGLLFGPIVRLVQFQSMWAGTRIAIDRMMEILDEPEADGLATGQWHGRETVPQLTAMRTTGQWHGRETVPQLTAMRTIRGAISVRDVSFRYRTGAPLVLDGVNLSVRAGETVALVGPSGAGKSTLLALLPGLYELPLGRGRIALDGCDIRGLDPAALRRAVVLVSQQAVLFGGTIRTNLGYANRRATEPAMEQVLDALALLDLVRQLPAGLDTPVGDRGVTLSGGQRQRLALARAMLAEPRVLLLDDCTSALDADIEAQVYDALDELLPDCTRLVVSHKPSVARWADRVVALWAGRVATHTDFHHPHPSDGAATALLLSTNSHG